jgi:hypothetical protein
VEEFAEKYGLYLSLNTVVRTLRLTELFVAGQIFSRRVKLGGRLMSSHQSTSTNSQEQADSENSLKATAAASISGWGFSASAEASHEEGQKSSSSEKKQNFASTMSWEATGGNTVLCNK